MICSLAVVYHHSKHEYMKCLFTPLSPPRVIEQIFFYIATNWIWCSK